MQLQIKTVSQPPLKPTFIIIGAQKGGTSALFTYLSDHPGLLAPTIKEINFFSCQSRYSLGLSFYHSHFPRKSSKNTQVQTFDVTPDYLTSALAAYRIHSYNPKMKLIALLRDPIKRAYSAWQMYRGYYRSNSEWFFEWMYKCDSSYDSDSYVRRSTSFGESFEDDILAELDTNEHGRKIEMPFLLHGFYYHQLYAYLNVFSIKQMLIENSEQFLNQKIAVLSKIEDFVGIQRHTWDETLLEPVFVGQYDKGIPIPPRAIQILKAVYNKHNQSLYSLLGRNFSWL